MHYSRAAIVIVLLLLLSCVSARAHQEDSLKAYYFFSTSCPGCTNSVPFIKKLSAEIAIRGFLFGQGDTEPMPFIVRKDDEAARDHYDVRTFPALIIVKNGEEKQTFLGEQDIKHARLFLNALRQGAWSVSEMIKNKPLNTEYVVGWITSTGAYFRQPQFYLTDRRQSISVTRWLPLEAAKSPFRKTRPRLMSDVISKPVFLEGVLSKINDALQFTVRKEIILE